MKNPEDDEWYTPNELAQLFRVHPKTLSRWVRQDKFEKYRIRVMMTKVGHRRYNKEDALRVYNMLYPEDKDS